MTVVDRVISRVVIELTEVCPSQRTSRVSHSESHFENRRSKLAERAKFHRLYFDTQRSQALFTVNKMFFCVTDCNELNS